MIVMVFMGGIKRPECLLELASQTCLRISVERIVRKEGNMSQYILMGGDIESLLEGLTVFED